MPDGTTINSTETLGSQVTAEADTDDDKETDGLDLRQSYGPDLSDTTDTTDNTTDDVNATDVETESVQSTVSTTDPTTGLTVFSLTKGHKH